MITDQKEASGLVNQQVLVTMVLGGPVLVMLFLCAPLVLQILYSADFLAGTTMLRWQTAANFFYLIATTLSFILLAQKLITFFLTYTVLFALLLFTMSIDFVLMLGIGIPSVVVLAWLGLRILLQEVDKTHPALQRLRRLLRFV